MAKKFSRPKDEFNPDDWMTTYSDMVTLLMCFFIMLVASSKVDIVLFEQIKSSMSKEISQRSTQQPSNMLQADLKEDLKSLQVEDQSFLGSDSKGLVLEFANTALFSSGAANLRPEAETIMKRIARTLSAERYSRFHFEVQGHTDDNPINTPAFPSNWELSAARAAAVVRYLVGQNLDPVRFRAIGMADIQPKLNNRDPEGNPIPEHQAENRRITIRIEY